MARIDGPKGTYLLPRDDIPASQGCFRLFQKSGGFLGFIQKFKDGTYAYWKVPKQQARPAATLDVAVQKLEECPAVVFRDTCHSLCLRPIDNPRGLVYRFRVAKNEPPGTLIELETVPCPCGCGGFTLEEKRTK